MNQKSEQLQLPYIDSLAESSFYHQASGQGFFSILTKKNGETAQRSYRLSQMPKVIGMVDQQLDTWISQAEFFAPNRRVVNLARIGLFFADLDTYNVPNMSMKTPEAQAAALNFYCDDEGIPKPSVIVYSGRGLQAKWLLSNAIPREALVRWSLVQKALNAALQGFGADKNALDASRVLRLVDTVNTKNGQIARVVDVNSSGQSPVSYDFDQFADHMLPFTRLEIDQRRVDRAAGWAAEKADRAAKRAKFSLVSVNAEAHKQRFHGMSSRTLAWARLEDIRTLGNLRGGWAKGSRDKALFWQINFLALAGAVNESNLLAEALELSKSVFETKPSHYEKSSMTTLVEKAGKYARGDTVEFNNKKYPALYTPRNATLMDIFEVTSDEQKHMKTLIDSDEKEGRRKAKRHAGGMKPRDVYSADRKAQSNQLHESIRSLKAEGLGATQIAEKLGVSRPTVYAALKV